MPHHFIIDVQDPLGRRITLTPETWDDHQSRRPEIEGHLDAVGPTVTDADFVTVTEPAERRFYKKGVVPGWENHFLQVIVRLESGTRGRIATVWFTRIPEGEQIEWLRPDLESGC